MKTASENQWNDLIKKVKNNISWSTIPSMTVTGPEATSNYGANAVISLPIVYSSSGQGLSSYQNGIRIDGDISRILISVSIFYHKSSSAATSLYGWFNLCKNGEPYPNACAISNLASNQYDTASLTLVLPTAKGDIWTVRNVDENQIRTNNSFLTILSLG